MRVILLQTSLHLDIWLQSYVNAKNNIKQQNLNTIFAYTVSPNKMGTKTQEDIILKLGQPHPWYFHQLKVNLVYIKCV